MIPTRVRPGLRRRGRRREWCRSRGMRRRGRPRPLSALGRTRGNCLPDLEEEEGPLQGRHRWPVHNYAINYARPTYITEFTKKKLYTVGRPVIR